MDTVLATDTRADYTGPVARLLTFGEPVGEVAEEWTDYPAQFGFDAGHVDDLIRMACDEALNLATSENDEIWAPVHAMRALGQLRAEAAVAPLLEFIATDAGEYTPEYGLPEVFGMIGQPAIAPVAGYILDRSKPTLPVGTAIEGLGQIAKRHPQCRSACVETLEQRLRLPAPVDPTINGFAVSALIDLAEVGSIDVIRDAFQRGVVDVSFAGDLEDVEIALGVREHRVTPKPRYTTFPRTLEVARESHVHVPQQPVRREKVGRNAPCPCGSGKKYKKCCLQ